MHNRLTIEEHGSDELAVRLVQVTSPLRVTENGLSQLGELLEACDERQDADLALLRDLYLFHLSNLPLLKRTAKRSVWGMKNPLKTARIAVALMHSKH